MRDGIEGGLFKRTTNTYCWHFRGFSMWLKVLGLIEYSCGGAATLTLKCVAMFTSVTTNDVPAELCCQMTCRLSLVAKSRERFIDNREASRCDLKFFQRFSTKQS
jgi:hypothetical protein